MERGQMRVGAAVEADDGEVEAFVRAHDLAVTASRGRDGQAGRSGGKCVEEFSTRNHLFSIHPVCLRGASTELECLAHGAMRKDSTQVC